MRNESDPPPFHIGHRVGGKMIFCLRWKKTRRTHARAFDVYTYSKKRGESQHAKSEARRRRLAEGDLSRRDVYTEKLRDAAWMAQRGAARSSAESSRTDFPTVCGASFAFVALFALRTEFILCHHFIMHGHVHVLHICQVSVRLVQTKPRSRLI